MHSTHFSSSGPEAVGMCEACRYVSDGERLLRSIAVRQTAGTPHEVGVWLCEDCLIELRDFLGEVGNSNAAFVRDWKRVYESAKAEGHTPVTES